MTLGKASSIGVFQFSGEVIHDEVNNWLEENPDVEVIDIRFTASATATDWATDAFIIFRK